MKKIISAVLALLLLATCLTPSIGAIDATQDEVVLFTDCDSLDGWSGYGLKPPALDTAVFKDGRGSISMTLDGRVEATVPGQHFNMQYSNEARPLNVTGMHTLIFDLYVQNVAGIKNVKFEIELRSPGGDDNNELVRRATFNELVEGGLREGWNRVELPLSTMLRNGSFDDTQCTYFRIYNYPTTLGSEGKVTAMKLDNVSFVGVPVEDGEEDQDNMELLFCNCDNISGWSGYGHNPPVLDTTVVKEGAGSISMRLEGSAEATAPGQHFNMQYKNESKPLNVTGMHTLVFDLYVQNVAGIENVKFEIELRSPGGNDNNELVRRATLGELVEGGLREGWNRAELPLDSMVQVGSFDKAQCTYFRMYNYPTTLGTDGKTTVLNIDHLRFLGALDPAMYEDVMLADCDTTGGWSGVGIALDRKEMSQGKGSISTTIKGFKPNAGHGSAIQSIYTRTKGVNVAHLNTLAFDLYVENVQGVAKTTFEFELRSPGGSDHNELMCVTLLDGIAVSGMLTEGWNQIEIPLKDFVRNGTVDLTNCNYFRVYNRQGDIGVADENTVFKLDNIRFIYVDEAAGPRATICCSYLADGAVYQQHQPMAIWGASPNGVEIKAELYCGTTLLSTATTVAEDHRWSLSLDGQPGGYTSHTVKLYFDGEEHATYQDILFGEVWLASGQSNMELFMQDTYEYEELLEAADDSYLRVFQVQTIPPGVEAPQVTVGGTWVAGDEPNRLYVLSAIPYSFGDVLRDELDVPVAVIAAARGSTSIESWLSLDAINSEPDLKQQMIEIGMYTTAPVEYTEATAMYNAKISPLTELSIAGVLWYQGEGNVHRGELYRRQLELLYNSWSDAFGFARGTMPFVFAQLAPYSSSGAVNQNHHAMSAIKQSMLDFYEAHADVTAMIPFYDVSLRYLNENNPAISAAIHPTTKRPVAERMALAALGLCYGGEEATAPVVSNVRFEKDGVYVTFAHVGSGLTLTNAAKDVLGFSLGNADGVWINAPAKLISADTVFVSTEWMPNATYVAYAWDDMNTDANLCASHGIPAAPFCSGGEGGLGSRAYLNCDGNVFVTNSFATGVAEEMPSDYTNLWTLLQRATVAFDQQTCTQGLASLHATYAAGNGTVVVGMDLTDAAKYSVTTTLEGIRQLSVCIKNADAWEKEIRLMLGTANRTAYTAPQTLTVGEEFTTLTFDLTALYDEDGAAITDGTPILSKMLKLALCIADTQQGSVWIDALRLGARTSETTEDPNADHPADEQPTDPDATEQQKKSTLLSVLLGVALALVVVAAVVVLLMVKHKTVAYAVTGVLAAIAIALVLLLVLRPNGQTAAPAPETPPTTDVGSTETEEEEMKKLLEQYNYVLGTQVFKPAYQFTDALPEIEVGDRIAEMGSNMIKFDATDDEKIDAVMQANAFDHVFMWYRSSNAFRDGYSEQEREDDYQAIYSYTKKLLTDYNGSGVNFYLGHWEGDWYYLGSYDYSIVQVDDVVTEGMIAWMNNRQKAVDDAKRDTPHENVYVWNYLELNRPTEALDDTYDRVVNRVLPHTNVDYVSYSAYDSMNLSAEQVAQTIDLIYENLPDKEGIPGPRVFIGEVGQPQTGACEDTATHCEVNLTNIAKYLACDVKFVLYWQMYDNEGSAFWLINRQNEKLPLYYSFESILQSAKDYVRFFHEENGRVPTNEEYRQYLLTLPEFSD